MDDGVSASQGPRASGAAHEDLFAAAEVLFSRAEASADIDDLHTAISMAQDAIQMAPPEFDRMWRYEGSLSSMLKSLFDEERRESDLVESNKHARTAIELHGPRNDPEFVFLQHNLALGLWTWFSIKGDQDALEQSLQLSKQTVASSPNSPFLPDFLHGVSVKESSRYHLLGNGEDLDDAIEHVEHALRIAPDTHPERADWYNDLAVNLESRFILRSDPEDIERAVDYSRKADELQPDDVVYMSNLASNLESRYNWAGDPADLETAIAYSLRTIEDSTSPHYAVYLIGHGSKLRLRSELRNDSDDAKHAVSHILDGLDLIDLNDSKRFGYKSTLASALQTKYETEGNSKDLEVAINIFRSLLKDAPPEHPDRTAWVHNLAASVLLDGKPDSITNLIESVDVELKRLPVGHSDTPSLANILAVGYRARYDSTSKPEFLSKSIDWGRKAVAGSSLGTVQRATYEVNLAEKLIVLYLMDQDPTHLRNALGQVECARNTPHTPQLQMIWTLRVGIKALMLLEEWKESRILGQQCIKLLPLVCGRYRTMQDQQHVAKQVSGLAADCCSLALRMGDIEGAIGDFEVGHGMILGNIIDRRGDLTALRQDLPELAKEFEDLQLQASVDVSRAKSAIIQEKLGKERNKAIEDIETCLDKIRQDPKYHDFLQPPSLDDRKVKGLSIHGPIIILNVTDTTADAIILSERGLHQVALPTFLSSDRPRSIKSKVVQFSRQRGLGGQGTLTRDLSSEDTLAPSRPKDSELTWLWENCVGVIIGELKGMGLLKEPLEPQNDRPRVWWICSGVARSLPVHAACASPTAVVGTTGTSVLSSYVPSLKALSFVRSLPHQEGALDTAVKSKLSMLLVAVPETPGYPSLPGAARERDAVAQVCNDVYECAAFTTPDAETVLENAYRADIFHFAGHAMADAANALESSLVLCKEKEGLPCIDRLSLLAISDLTLESKPWLAFLSACSTAAVEARGLADQSLHLAAAFQMIGFGHVIGSLWPADDEACALLAEAFYGGLVRRSRGRISHREVSAVLDEAIARVRNEYPDPAAWASFVHFGP